MFIHIFHRSIFLCILPEFYFFEMKTFLPTDAHILFYTFLFLVSVLTLGFLITRIRNFKLSIVLSWSLLIISTLVIDILCYEQRAGYRMLTIILSVLFSMKVIVTVESYKKSTENLTFIKWLAFTIGWFGMRPKLFESLGEKPMPGAKQLIFLGISRIIAGTCLLFIAWLISNVNGVAFRIIYTGLQLISLSLILHFGILNVNAGIWRLLGVDARTLFRDPVLSLTLTEFWGKRWNLAFSEMTAIAVYRPLRFSLGVTGATITAFLFSGLLHEFAISVPAKGGYGLPMLYFLIQGTVMVIEKSTQVKGRLWVVFWLIAPMPLLFPQAFLQKILWPIIGM
jgi:alginate O-acetyltransferase complex protein AlgI